MIRLHRFHHVSFMVSDLEASKDFYGRVLGLKEISRPDFGFPGAWYQLGDIQLHLISGRVPHTPDEAPGPRDEHVAFAIDDYEGTIKRLKEEGIPHLEQFIPALGFRQVFARDPNGNMVEFIDLGGEARG